jgi:hypothetical protein
MVILPPPVHKVDGSPGFGLAKLCEVKAPRETVPGKETVPPALPIVMAEVPSVHKELVAPSSGRSIFCTTAFPVFPDKLIVASPDPIVISPSPDHRVDGLAGVGLVKLCDENEPNDTVPGSETEPPALPIVIAAFPFVHKDDTTAPSGRVIFWVFTPVSAPVKFTVAAGMDVTVLNPDPPNVNVAAPIFEYNENALVGAAAASVFVVVIVDAFKLKAAALFPIVIAEEAPALVKNDAAVAFEIKFILCTLTVPVPVFKPNCNVPEGMPPPIVSEVIEVLPNIVDAAVTSSHSETADPEAIALVF